MKDLKKLIKEHLLLEKRIDIISSDIQVKYNFEIIRVSHADDRSIRPELKGTDYNQSTITNSEIKYVFGLAKRKIAEKIATHYIQNEVRFIIKSINYELSMVIAPYHVGETLWIMNVITVFRESPYNSLRVGENQLVINV
jgi:hypothetical protein